MIGTHYIRFLWIESESSKAQRDDDTPTRDTLIEPPDFDTEKGFRIRVLRID
jgi:hypothetical protein